jgi:hypothetical protein
VHGEAFLFGVKEESSFCEQKEAKKLYDFAPVLDRLARAQVGKVFWFFFSKKNCLLMLGPSRAPAAETRSRPGSSMAGR